MKRRADLQVVGGSAANASERAAYAAHSAEQLSDGCPSLPQVDISARAIQRRAILRVGQFYPWGMSTIRGFLDNRGVPHLDDLTQPQMDDLHERMLAYKESADNGFSAPDEPVAC